MNKIQKEHFKISFNEDKRLIRSILNGLLESNWHQTMNKQ